MTIVIPTFNRFEYVRQAIDSSLAQSVETKVIVVDHGSTDRTPEIAAEYSEGIDYVRRPRDSGPIFSWLDGCLSAETEFVKILFDDDVLEPSFIEKTMDLFSPEVAFVFSRASAIDSIGTLQGLRLGGLVPHTGVYSGSSARRAINSSLISPSAAVFRREDLIDSLFVGKLPIQNRSYFGAGPDHLVKFVSTMRRPAFGYVDEALVSFRSHPGSITAGARENREAYALKSVYREIHAIGAIFAALNRLKLVEIVLFFMSVSAAALRLQQLLINLLRASRRRWNLWLVSEK